MKYIHIGNHVGHHNEMEQVASFVDEEMFRIAFQAIQKSIEETNKTTGFAYTVWSSDDGREWNDVTLTEYAASHFLYTDLPYDWDGMDDKQLFAALEDLACGAYENYEGSEIWEHISAFKNSINNTFRLGVNI